MIRLDNTIEEGGLLLLTRHPLAPEPGDAADVSRYRGFDAESMYTEEILAANAEGEVHCGLASPDQYIELKRAFEELRSHSWKQPVDLLYLCLARSRDKFFHDDFEFLGYDFGSYIGPHNYFSVILNEVAIGLLKDMRCFGERLNQNLLFSDLKDACLLAEKRELLYARHAGGELEAIDNELEIPRILEVHGFAH